MLQFTALELTLLLLLAAVIGVVGFRLLQLPPMLGYLAVGILIGPHAFGLVPESEGTRYLAEFGVVFLMFSIGLEFNLNKLRSMRELVFGLGPAGTGKTYLAMAKAVQALQRKEVSRIILSRPAIEAGERLGFLPGTLTDKIDPYLRPLYDALHDDFPQQAQYAVSMAYRMRYSMQFNAREAIHLLELRSSPQGHPSYRRVVLEMHRLIDEQAGHRTVAAAMQHLTTEAPELERLESERRAEARRQQT